MGVCTGIRGAVVERGEEGKEGGLETCKETSKKKLQSLEFNFMRQFRKFVFLLFSFRHNENLCPRPVPFVSSKECFLCLQRTLDI